MKKFLVSTLAALFLVSSTGFAGSLSFSAKKAGTTVAPAVIADDVVTLTPDNLVVFRGEVDGKSVSRAIEQISAAKSNDIYLYLSTPGGSVLDGLHLVSFILSTPKRVTCVVDFAASMGFVLTQACGNRIVQTSSILMQHEAAFGARGQPEPHIVSFVNFLVSMTESMKRAEAARMKITFEEYKAKTRNDLWLFGDKAVEAGAADSVKGVSCDPRLFQETETETFNIFIFTATVVWNKCPLITEPKSVAISAMNGIFPSNEEIRIATGRLNSFLSRNYTNLRGSMFNRDYSKTESSELSKPLN